MTFINKFTRIGVYCASLMLISSFAANAVPITNILSNSDITSIEVSKPAGWTAHNLDLLFDGNSSRYTKKRFAGYQRSGNLLSDSNSFSINVLLNESVDVSSISFYNDWRHHLGQQVDALSLSLLDSSSQSLWSGSFSDLMLYTWDKIDLVAFKTPVENVRQLDFTVTKSQGNHFEIREFVVETVNMPELAQVSVSAPASIGIVLLSLLCIASRKLIGKS